jgi:DNA primase
MSYAKEDLDAIRNKVDMLTFLENRGISFRNSGASWVGLCPVHSERSPSFHVRPAQQTFRCFGCGISGDIFSLVQEMEQLSFPGAVQLLAEEAGITLKFDDDPNFKHRQRLLTITRLAAEWYRHHYGKIPMNHPAKLNLEQRNLLEYSISDDSVGFAPSGGLLPLLKEKGFSDTELIEAGIATKNEETNVVRERFRNRLIWTIYDVQGRPIGFSARKIFENDNGPKYTNSPQTELYNKSKALLGISSAKRSISQLQQAYVVEGQTDVMALKAAGKINAVASCGTAFGAEHSNMLLHLSKLGKHADKFQIVFCFDGDAAGIKAAKKVFYENPQIHLNSYAVKFIDENNEATDPCDYRKTYGDEQLVSFIDNKQIPLVEFVLSEMRSEWKLNSPEGKSGYVSAAMDVLNQVSDRIQHSAYIRKVAAWTGLSYEELDTWAARAHIRSQQQSQSKEPAKPEIAPIFENADKAEVNLLACLVQFPQESINVINKLNLDVSFFLTQPDVAQKLIDSATNNIFDYNDPIFIQLSHHDLNIDDSRKEAAVESSFRSYLRHLYVVESAKLDNELISGDNSDPVAVFIMVTEKQEALKQRYLQ